jgi:hypothetical protein
MNREFEQNKKDEPTIETMEKRDKNKVNGSNV